MATSKARRLLNEAIQECNEIERKYTAVNEEVEELQHKLSEQKKGYDEANIENIRLKEANRGKDQKLRQLREQLDDNGLEQKNLTLETRVHQVEDQLQNCNEKYHVLQVKYSKALSSQRAIKQQADSENKELAKDWQDTVKEMEELMGQLEEKDSIIQKLQNDLQVKKTKESEDETNILFSKGVGNLRARRLLNEAIQERNEFERKYMVVDEEVKELQHKLFEANTENSRLKEANKNKDQELGQLREQLDDNKYYLEQKNATLETRVRQVEHQLQNCNENYHVLQVEYAKALSSQRAIKQQADSENKELEQEWKGTVKEMEELMGQLEEKESIIRKLQNDLQQVLSQKENAESDLNHSQQKLKQKQNDCDNYLSQMEAWRVQYETAQSEMEALKTQFRAVKQQADSENKELAKDWQDIVKEMEELMGQLEEKESIIRKLQNDLQQVLSQKENAESDLNHSQQKLKQKQNDCDNYLSQMEAWRAQYETAQSDFAQVQAIREKEAKAVQTLRENRDELQREIGELRKRVTDQRITIANLQTLRDELQREIGKLRTRVTDQRITIANLQTYGYVPD